MDQIDTTDIRYLQKLCIKCSDEYDMLLSDDACFCENFLGLSWLQAGVGRSQHFED